jgi:molybdate transport system substrate-binding protein
MMRRGNFYELSEKECAPIAQSGIVLKGKSQTESQDFFDFINSEKANEIWKRYGYQTKISK